MNETINKQIHLAMTSKAEITYEGVCFDVEYDFTPDDPSVGFRAELWVLSITHKGTEFSSLLTSDQTTDIERLIIKERDNHEF